MYDLALEKYRAGNFLQAIEILNSKTAKSSGEYNLLGWAYLKSGNPDKAIKQFNNSLKLKSSGNDSYCGLGYTYLQVDQYDKALQHFT